MFELQIEFICSLNAKIRNILSEHEYQSISRYITYSLCMPMYRLYVFMHATQIRENPGEQCELIFTKYIIIAIIFQYALFVFCISEVEEKKTVK